MKAKYLPVSLLAFSIATSNAFGAVGDVVLTTSGRAVSAAWEGAVIGTVDLSSFVTYSKLDETLGQFVIFLHEKAEDVTTAKNAAEAAAASVASKVNSSDLSSVAFTGNASALNNDAGFITQSDANSLIASAVNDNLSEYATQSWANDRFATKEWAEQELEDVASTLVTVMQQSSAATLAANNATAAVASKANASDVYSKTESDDKFATKTWVQEEFDDIGTFMDTTTAGFQAMGNSINALNTEISTKANSADLATVATSGKSSDLDNDAGFITNAALNDYATTDSVNSALANYTTTTDMNNLLNAKANASDVYSKTDADSLFATTESVSDIQSQIDWLEDVYANVTGTSTQMETSIASAQNTANAAQSLAESANTKATFAQELYMSAIETLVDMNTEIGNTQTALDTKANISDLATVATSGKASDLDNDAGFITSAALSDYATTTDMNNLLSTKADASTVYTKSEIDAKTDALESTMSEFARTSDLDSITSQLSELSNTVSGATQDYTTAIDAVHSANATASLASTIASGAATTASAAADTANEALHIAQNSHTAVESMQTTVQNLNNAMSDKVSTTDLATVATSGKASDLDNDAGFITGADLANYATTDVMNSMLADKVSINDVYTRDQINETLGSMVSTVSLATTGLNNVSDSCTMADAITSLDSTIGGAITHESNGVLATNSVNENIVALSDTIGDSAEMHNGNAITNGTGTMPETVVSAINNIDETIGKIHHLFDGSAVDSTHIASTTGAGSNLAIGTTVEDHLVNLDNAIGDRNIASANATINAAAAVSISDALSATGDLIGNMDFSGTTYLGGVSNITDALRTLDANIATGGTGGASVAAIAAIDHKIDHVEKRLNKGMAAMSALTALVPNARASGRTQISVGTGTYGDRVGIAAGAFHYINNRVLVNAGASYGGSGDMAFRAGITFGW